MLIGGLFSSLFLLDGIMCCKQMTKGKRDYGTSETQGGFWISRVRGWEGGERVGVEKRGRSINGNIRNGFEKENKTSKNKQGNKTLPYGIDASMTGNSLLYFLSDGICGFYRKATGQTLLFSSNIHFDNIRCYTETVPLQIQELKLIFLPHALLCFRDGKSLFRLIPACTEWSRTTILWVIIMDWS